MKRALALGIILLGGFVTLLVFDGATAAYATGGPHGEYTATTDYCAGCHRSHTALGSSKLLKDAASTSGQIALNLCKFCHNGSGSALDVLDGLRIDLTGNGGNTVPKATSATQLEVSVAPAAKSLTTTATDSTTYTISVKNTSGANITGTIARTQTNTATTNFDTDLLSVTSFTNLAPAATTTTVLTVGTGTAATAGMVNLSTVTATVTAGGENAAVKVNTRIGSWKLLSGGYQYFDGAAVTSTHFNAVDGTEQTADDSKKPWGYAGTTGVTRESYGNIAAGTTYTPGDANPGQTGKRPGDLLAGRLECISCHNPHGSANYRMLKASLNGFTVNVKAWSGTATVYNDGTGASETARRGLDGDASGTLGKYTDSYERYYSAGSNVLVEANLTQGANDVNANIASFCSACHTAYPASSPTGGLIAQAETHYRHPTEKAVTGRPGCAAGTCDDTMNPEDGASRAYPSVTMRLGSKDETTLKNEYMVCLTCHRAHGTTAAMSGSYSQGAAVSTGGGVTAGKSALLFLDNRGVCQVCHQW